ncbi:MAG: hypothetical protein FJ213_04465 [Ignavibacteria bacterium]|nr:hypothetical protein [Ignavibacteria bacterium]
MKKLFVVSCLLLITQSIFAQRMSENYSTGNLRTDLNANFNYQALDTKTMSVSSSEKSVFLAGVLSALIPGAGEIYSESYIKGGIFLLIEAAAWYFNFSYIQKGDDQTVVFKNFADSYWSVVRYAEWLNRFAADLGGTSSILINPDSSLNPWKRVNWDEVIAAEKSVKEFSHTLYPHGHQQYYELIGKYPQYNKGWNDADPNSKRYYDNLSANFLHYSGLRGNANDYYNVAAKAVLAVVLNHVLSLADAIWTANSYNAELKANLTMERLDLGLFTEYYPQLNLKIAF